VFVECALSIHEKQTEVEDFARQGREKGESYAEFAARLRRLVEVYRVRELAKQSDVVTALKMSIPSLAMTVMQQGLIIKLLLEHVGMDVPDTNSVDFLMEAIPTALGPDDCMEWKAFIEGSKKARVLREADETKTNQVKQHQQQQQKQAVSGQVSGGAATSNATMSSATPAQHYQQGQPNGRGGGRGRGRGRFSHPYRGESHWEMSWVEIVKYVMEYQWKLHEFVQTIMEGVFKKTTDISIKNTYTKAKESKWT
jgi:hypothetical protein